MRLDYDRFGGFAKYLMGGRRSERVDTLLWRVCATGVLDSRTGLIV
jgi:hypothetical protein